MTDTTDEQQLEQQIRQNRAKALEELEREAGRQEGAGNDEPTKNAEADAAGTSQAEATNGQAEAQNSEPEAPAAQLGDGKGFDYYHQLSQHQAEYIRELKALLRRVGCAAPEMPDFDSKYRNLTRSA